MKICPRCQRCFEDEILYCSEENHEILADGREGGCELIANYRLDFLRESSPMGEIYRGVNTSNNKPCSIKIIAPQLFEDDSKLRELFLGEARDLSAIFHPNVARVFESGELADGSIYVVSEYFAEATLRDYLEQGNVAEATALTIAEQVAEGLTAIHALGVLHRNIRPENIVLTSDLENNLLVKLQNIDFSGIRQKIIRSQSVQDLSDLKYFSPEQCAGKIVDSQTDVYSLGIVLYEILAGNPPFDALDADVLIHQQLKKTPPPVHINNFNIRALLTHTLTDSLQKTKRLRLKTANIFARRIRYIEQIATPSSAPPPAMSYPLITEQENSFQIGKQSFHQIPEEILADLPTEELPSLESISKELFFNNETSAEETSAFTTEDRDTAFQPLNKPILIQWEQPEDIPPMPKILEAGDEAFATDFAVEPVFIDYEDPVIYAGEIDLPTSSNQTENYETEHRSGSYNWANFANKRQLLIGAGIVALLALVVGGRILTRQFQIAEDTSQTIAQSSPKEKSLPQIEKVLENDNPPIAKPGELTENSPSASVDSPEPPVLPDYQPRETNEKDVVPIAQSRIKKRAVKSPPADCNCDKTIQNKPVANESSPVKNVEIPVKKVEVIIVGRKSATESKPLKSAEISVFNRPRIVKNPKF